MTERQLSRWLKNYDAADSYIDIIDELVRAVPTGINFSSDEWNVIDWVTRVGEKRVRTLSFSTIPHPELRVLAKLWILDGRLKRTIGFGTAKLRLAGFRALAHVFGTRSLTTLKSDDFRAAERWLSRNVAVGTAFRVAGSLQSAARWIARSFSRSLDYRNALANPAVHGRYGTEEGRFTKLIPLEVLRDMLLALRRRDLLAKDRLFLSMFAANIGAGLRIGEMAGLPEDCLVREGGLLQVRIFSEKGGKSVARPINPLVSEMVEHAINTIRTATEAGRHLARQLRHKSCLDWSAIVRNRDVFRYFVAKWAHEWTSRPDHQLINPDGAWYGKRACFVDAIGALKKADGNKVRAATVLGVHRATFYDLLEAQRASRRGKLPAVRNCKSRGRKRISWDTDARVISIRQLEKESNIALHQTSRSVVRVIIETARAMQLKGKIYPAPRSNSDFEGSYLRSLRPVIRTKSGKGILYPDKALLVVEKYSLSESRGTKANDFTLISDHHISRWMSGEARSRGTGNHEDSVFRRLGIVDPRTGEIASFSWHAIRHWLDTVYENGGFTQDQIALIFNRKRAQNATYDQTSRKTRVDRIAQGIREKMVVGVVAETYQRLAAFSYEEAEEYLEAATRQVNPMPHGACTLDWSTTPCPHHLSCFKHESEREGPCEHLAVEAEDNDQMREVERIRRVAEMQITMLQEQLRQLGKPESPQLVHFKAVRDSAARVLDQIRVKRLNRAAV